MASSQQKRRREAAIFTAFLTTEPNFTGEGITGWTQPADDPPDVLCQTVSGRRVGVELKTWVNQEQVEEAVLQERREQAILAALAPLPENTTRHIALVWLSLKPTRLHAAHVGELRTQLLDVVDQADRDWPGRSWDSPQGHQIVDFADRLTLARYIDGVTLFPTAHHRPRRTGWITFPFRGGAYSPDDMVDPLREQLSEVWDAYQTTKSDKHLDALHLLIHYDDVAWRYCTPIDTPDYDFEEAAKDARFHVFATHELGKALELETHPPFDAIFLLVALQGRERVFRLF